MKIDTSLIEKALAKLKHRDPVLFRAVQAKISQIAGLDAASILARQGIEAAVLHVHTIKPLDADTILAYAAELPVIVTIEEHTIIGGLGSAVAEVILEANFNPAKRFKRIGIPDVFPDGYGSQESLIKRYSLTTENLVASVSELVGHGALESAGHARMTRARLSLPKLL